MTDRTFQARLARFLAGSLEEFLLIETGVPGIEANVLSRKTEITIVARPLSIESVPSIEIKLKVDDAE